MKAIAHLKLQKALTAIGALVIGAAIIFGIVRAYDLIVRATYIDEHLKGFALVGSLDNNIDMGRFDPLLTREPFVQFGIETNSKWAIDYTLRIVPLIAYEGIVEDTTYPAAVGFLPFPGDAAYTVWGMAWPASSVAFVNWRLATDETIMDEADALGVLVHELIHVQGGIFATGTSEELESATSAATVEVLAAMCNLGDDVACVAFLRDIQSPVRAALIRDLSWYGAEWVYQAYSDIFLRDRTERLIAAKSLRYWSKDPGARVEILSKYGVVPLERYIGPGLRGQTFSTAPVVGISGVPLYLVTARYGFLEFDDTRIALNRLSGPLVTALLATYGQ